MRRYTPMIGDGYPLYLHNRNDLINHWKNYFESYPIRDTDRVELYIDFPFCRSICKFCVYGCNLLSENKDNIQIYEDAVISLLSDMKEILPHRINNVYFGGGTPTLWTNDSIKKIISLIPNYTSIPQRTIEAHPVDITDDWIQFAVNDLQIKTVSIGVQSFDIESNKAHMRIPTTPDRMKHIVDTLHKHNVYVNIDLVALFYHHDEYGWELFEKDLEILASIQPDDLCSSVNFRSEKFFKKSIRYRQIIKSFLNKYPQYTLEHPEAISNNIKDIMLYEYEPYHLRTSEYHTFFNNAHVGILGSNLESIHENVVIGIGGDIKHRAISRLGMKVEDIYSYYDFRLNKFIHMVEKSSITDYSSNNHPTIKIGNCTIDTSID